MTKADRIDLYKRFMPEPMGVLKLDELGFFEAPASSKYHGAYEGGLFDHSYEVTKYLIKVTDKLAIKWKSELSPYVIGMYHDLCKCGLYTKEPDGTYKYNKDVLLPGHGERSVILAQKILDLTDEEIICIRWHMGAYEDPKLWDTYHKAINDYPNLLYICLADMYASKVVGV